MKKIKKIKKISHKTKKSILQIYVIKSSQLNMKLKLYKIF